MGESWRSRLLPGGVIAVLCVGWGIACHAGPETPAPAEPLSVGLQFVPPDAAAFVYADRTALWASAPGQMLIAAEKPAITELNDRLLKLTGLKADELKSVTWFAPSLKNPEDLQRFGIVFTAVRSIDAKALAAGRPQFLKLDGAALGPEDRTTEGRVTVGETAGDSSAVLCPSEILSSGP